MGAARGEVGDIALVAFPFTPPYVTVEERTFFDALRSSSRLSKRHGHARIVRALEALGDRN